MYSHIFEAKQSHKRFHELCYQCAECRHKYLLSYGDLSNHVYLFQLTIQLGEEHMLLPQVKGTRLLYVLELVLSSDSYARV